MNLIDVPKVGEKKVKLLNNLSIYSVDDLIRYYPYRFDIIKKMSIYDENSYDNAIYVGIIESNPVISFFKGKNKLSFRCIVQNKIIKVSIFNRAFMKNNIKVGMEVTLIGKYNSKTENFIASNILLSKIDDNGNIIPIYHLCNGITNKQLNLIINSLSNMYTIKNNIPDIIRNKYGFLNEDDAIKIIHNPKDEVTLKKALKTLKYEELYTYMMKIKSLKEKNMEHNINYIKNIDYDVTNNFIENLPFKLTIDQEKAVNKMLDILKSDTKMNVLLQGDVGSGKTIVSFVLAYACFTSGYQTALMAPTEVLAKQHYLNAKEIFKNTNIKIELLTGKLKEKEKKEIYKKLENGDINFLIGTHALISDKVTFDKLGLVITDEQHRFGVNQRLSLNNKGLYPDILMMSATPIPRSYALTIYGDLDVISIKSMPKGRVPVKTYVKKTSELKDVLTKIYEALKNNNQAYVIAPMIEEENEDYQNVIDLKRKFKLAFKNYNIEVMHGKMSEEEKNKVMNDFKEGKINILISTTVIEVGVDVANATVMVIFDADKFGLSQLHQLRGRVGRSSLESFCYLISDKDKKRLNIMEETNDGFKIAEEDFLLRGQGDLFGNRQSGDLLFKLSNIKKDYDLLVKVKNDIENYEFEK